LRLVRIFSRVKRFDMTLRGIVQTLPAIRPIFFNLVVIYYLFALAGMQLWAGATPDSYLYSFNSFLLSLYTLNYLNSIVGYTEVISTYGAISGDWAWLFFVLFLLCSVILMFNIMVAFILEGFRQQAISEEDPMYKRITRVASKFEMENGRKHNWRVSASRDPFHVLRSILIGEIIADEDTYAWLHYSKDEADNRQHDDKEAEEDDDDITASAAARNIAKEILMRGPMQQMSRSLSSFQGARGGEIYAKAKESITDWDSQQTRGATAGEAGSSRIDNSRIYTSSTDVRRKQRPLWQKWKMWWLGKGMHNEFYIPRIIRNERTSSVRIVWREDDQLEEDEPNEGE